MPHKLDRKRHKRDVTNRLRLIKRRYMKLTQNDSLAPDKALAALKDSEQVDRAKNLAQKLAKRGVYVRLFSER